MRLFFLLTLIVLSCPGRAQLAASDPAVLVNSTYDEQNAIISPDGQTLFFTIGNHPQNIGGKKDPGDIWISRLTGDQWSAPVHGGQLLNNRAYNAVAGISTKGDQLFLHGHYDASGSPARSQGIAISSNTGAGWSRPANISIPYYLNRSGLLSGTVSEDGSVFIFSAETYGTYGVEDLYVTLNIDGRWTEPKNLGPTINTQFQELSPSLGADHRTIYFSSNGRKGSGSFDVYSSVRLDDSWKRWTEPVNLGEGVNSSGRELFFRLTPEGSGIFTSTLNSDGYGDIRLHTDVPPPAGRDTVYVSSDTVNSDTSSLASLIGLPVPVDTAPTGEEEAHDRPDSAHSRYVKVYGKVINARTAEPLAATISFSAPSLADQVTASTAAGYSVSLPSTGAYSITVEAQGFISTLQKLDINTFEMPDLEMNFSLQPAVAGTTVNLKNVLFTQAKTEILPESFPELDLVVSFLKANPDIRIELSGHTDGRGAHADNVRLSQQRVNKVKEYLVSKGIEPRRISGKGYGGTRPIASNDTEESRRMNRRVEFTIKKS